MWIAMGGVLGVATIVFVLGLFSAQASRRHREALHRQKIVSNTQYRQAQKNKKSTNENQEAMWGTNTERDYSPLLAGIGMGQGKTH